jgi:hypothetical protein
VAAEKLDMTAQEPPSAGQGIMPYKSVKKSVKARREVTWGFGNCAPLTIANTALKGERAK